MAFEVDVNADSPNVVLTETSSKEESLIKKHPPKRLQRLEEQQNLPRTAEEILEKQKMAEARRMSILDEKVQKSKQLQANLMRRRTSTASGQATESAAVEEPIQSNEDDVKPEVEENKNTDEDSAQASKETSVVNEH